MLFFLGPYHPALSALSLTRIPSHNTKKWEQVYILIPLSGIINSLRTSSILDWNYALFENIRPVYVYVGA